jgi:hypothetical protein
VCLTPNSQAKYYISASENVSFNTKNVQIQR